MSLEVKSSCNKSSLTSARKKISECLDVISRWCGMDLTRENGWKFFTVIFFEENVEGHRFCSKCETFIIVGDEFHQKFPNIISNIPTPSRETEASAREEFKKVIKYLLFLASYEPVVTPRRLTHKVVKNIDDAGTEDNILEWNKLFYEKFYKMFC